MAKKHGKGAARKTGPKRRKVKTNVRLFKVDDVIWMLLNEEQRECEWVSGSADCNGFELKLRDGVDKDGDPTYAIIGMDWESVACDLGMDKCEYVINPDRGRYVLVYDEEFVDV